eukprot:365895-Chlamydomonas_euryale.AAC.2
MICFSAKTPLRGAEPLKVAFGFVAKMCMPDQFTSRKPFLGFNCCLAAPETGVPFVLRDWQTHTQLLTTSHSVSHLRIRGREGFGMPAWRRPGLLAPWTVGHKSRTLPRTLHSASVSADQHIRSHDISIYAPGLQIPRAMWHRRVAPRGTVRRQLGRARGHAHFSLKVTSACAGCSLELGAAAWRHCASHRLAD